MSDTYCVIVTYGTFQDARYSGGNTLEDALDLCETAVDLGYTDAKVWNEKDFKSHVEKKRKRATDSAGANPPAR